MAKRSKAEEAIIYYDALLYMRIQEDWARYQILKKETNSWQTTKDKRTRQRIRDRIQDAELQRQILRQVAARAKFEIPSYREETVLD